MIQLSPNECRALGVLIEKAQTTPQQYPLTLHALSAGCSQKNNRDPVFDLSEEQTLEALDSLRAKGFAREVMLSGSRVEKFRHVAREVLEITTPELVILAELLLRGPQTIGELKQRATRMHPLESTEIVKNVLDSLMARPEPLVKELPRSPGEHATRYAQLLCPKLHSWAAPAPATGGGNASGSSGSSAAASLNREHIARLENLEREVAVLRAIVQKLETALGGS